MGFWGSSWELLTPYTFYGIAIVTSLICFYLQKFLESLEKRKVSEKCCFCSNGIRKSNTQTQLPELTLLDIDIQTVNEIFEHLWKKENHRIVEYLKNDLEAYIIAELKSKAILNLFQFKFGVIKLGNAPSLSDIKIKLVEKLLTITLSVTTKADNSIDFSIGQYNGYVKKVEASGRVEIFLELSTQRKFLIKTIAITFLKAPSIDFDFFIIRKNLFKSQVMKITNKLIKQQIVHPNSLVISFPSENEAVVQTDGLRRNDEADLAINENNEYLLLFESVMCNLNKLEGIMPVNPNNVDEIAEEIDESLEEEILCDIMRCTRRPNVEL